MILRLNVTDGTVYEVALCDFEACGGEPVEQLEGFAEGEPSQHVCARCARVVRRHRARLVAIADAKPAAGCPGSGTI